MNRRVIILVVIVVVLLGAVGAFVLLGSGGGDDEAADPATDNGADTTANTGGQLTQADIDATATAAAVLATDGGETDDTGFEEPVNTEFAPVVIAQQDLPRGFRLTSEFISGGSPAVGLAFWPVGSIPQNHFAAVEDVEGFLVRSDIPRESPILTTQLVADPTDLANVGSDAALILPPGTVAISMPLPFDGIGGVAFGLQPGDYVDLILSFNFFDVDETFQSRQPNFFSVLQRAENGDLTFCTSLQGRPEPSTLSSLGVLVSPSEQQRPRLVTQRTVERALVVHVGFFPPDGRILGVMTPTPFNTPTPASEEEAEQQAAAQPVVLPTSTPYIPVIVTLGMEPQDALVVTWALEANLPATLALRSATDTGSTPTTAVTLQYLIENYSVPRPPTLPFAVEAQGEADLRALINAATFGTSNDPASDGAADN